MRSKYDIEKNRPTLVAVSLLTMLLVFAQAKAASGESDNKPDWFYPEWAATAKYSAPIDMRDTDSALSRYTRKAR